VNAEAVRAKTLRTCGLWDDALGHIEPDAFAQQTGASDWTLGQVCDHVLTISELFLDGAEALARNRGETRPGSLFGKFICLLGSFPPVRIKPPTDLPIEFRCAAKPDSIRKDVALARFDAVTRRTQELHDAVEASPRALRSQHPAAGWINAQQWYQLSEMHMRHHLRQLRRIEKALAG
jgi:hypothetical protein